MLRLKAYIGIKTYVQKEEMRETKAVWPPIIDESTFNRVGKLLDKNKSRYKPHKDGKFPYLFSGLTFCMKCSNHMVGKSATGRKGKVGYYEHSWATKRDSCLSKKMFKCDPHRIPSKKLEPIVWEKVVSFATDPEFMKTVFEKVKSKHESNPLRLGGKTSFDRIVGLETFESFTDHYRKFILGSSDVTQRRQLIKKFVNRIDIGTESFKIHFIVDKDHYKQELALTGTGSSPNKFLRNFGSHTLTVGAQVEQVDEPVATFAFEVQAYPEAKALSAIELANLYERLKSFYKVADLIGSSEAFARQNSKQPRS